MKRSPLPRRRKRIKQRSIKQSVAQAERDEVVWRVRNRDRTCQARAVPHVCGIPLDVHEIIPRSAWPGGYLDDTNCVLVCRAAHNWIDDHPDEAHDLGLHGYSWERER